MPDVSAMAANRAGCEETADLFIAPNAVLVNDKVVVGAAIFVGLGLAHVVADA